MTERPRRVEPSVADVVVVGFGAAAMAAAITAHDAGVDVVLLEKMPPATAGGNTRVSGSVWSSPADVDQAKVHLRALAQQFPIDEEIVAAWALETSKNTAWMRERLAEVAGKVERDPLDPHTGRSTDITKITCGEEMGGKWDPNIPEHEFPELEANDCGTEWYYLGGSQGFSRVWFTLKACVELRDIPVMYETRARELLRDEDGAIVGVLADTPRGTTTVRARRGVVLACGGFENDEQMCRDFLRLPVTVPWGSPANTGDGHRMAMKAGADLGHMSNFMATSGIRLPGYEVGEWVEPVQKRYILVGADGKRFIDDSTQSRHGMAPMRGAFDKFPGVDHYTIFDEDARLAGPLVFPNSAYAANWLKQIHRYEWSEGSTEEIEKGWIARGQTVAELAEALGVDREGLERTVEEYNGFVDAGVDRRFDRPAATMVKIARGPFYGFRWGGVLINTLGGPRKDAGARVLDPDRKPIPGLYAAGEISATYTSMLEGGGSIGDAWAFGRIAGRNVAQEPDRTTQRTAAGALA